MAGEETRPAGKRQAGKRQAGKRQVSNRQSLAAELRRVRDLAGISGRDLAHRIGISQSKVSRIESGASVPSAPEVAAWAEAAGAPAETRQLLATLTEAVFTEVHTWRTVLDGRTHLQDDIGELESRTGKILTFQPSLIPGLLQTAEYARRVFTLFDPPYPERDIPDALAGRLDRQLALFDENREFGFLITEAALRWRPGPPELLLAQFDRIASLSTLSNVSIGLIPHAARAITSTAHSFVIFESRGKAHGDGHDKDHELPDSVVTVETIHANLTINDPESVALYRRRWSLLAQMAIYGGEARAFLTTVGSGVLAAEL